MWWSTVTTPEEILLALEVASKEDPNVCCCGDSMDHSPWMHGHTPVSARYYYMHTLWVEFWKSIEHHKHEVGNGR